MEVSKSKPKEKEEKQQTTTKMDEVSSDSTCADRGGGGGTTSSSNIDMLETDSLSMILSFLSWKEILKARLVCQKWKEAARITPVPQTYYEYQPYTTMKEPELIPDIFVRNDIIGHCLGFISEAIPRIPSIILDNSLIPGFTIEVDLGEDWEERFLVFDPDGPPPMDLKILEKFRDLQNLKLREAGLNGRYPFLFGFPKLCILDVTSNPGFKWDLSDLSGLPNLVTLKAGNNSLLTGSLKSLRRLHLKLVDLNLHGCRKVEGSLHDLADFPNLKNIYLWNTPIEGDIRNVGENDFAAIELLEAGEKVYGAREINSVAEASTIMLARYYLRKRNPKFCRSMRECWCLSETSHDYYEQDEAIMFPDPSRDPPMWMEFVVAGPRIGWRWLNHMDGGYCETIWFDKEPKEEDPGYNDYIRKLQWEQREGHVNFYRGFKDPPTERQHRELCANTPLENDPPVAAGAW